MKKLLQKQVRTVSSDGFTLIELLVVIAIMGMLMGLLFPAVASARRHARRTATIAEIKNIELAWQRYYAEYRRWPSVFGGMNPEIFPIPVMGTIAKVLEGENENGQNPKKFRFMSFKDHNEAGVPVSPFFFRQSPVINPLQSVYFCKFDTDFDNKIRPGMGGAPFDPPDNEVDASVIVWTVDESGGKNELFGSWEE